MSKNGAKNGELKLIKKLRKLNANASSGFEKELRMA